MTNVDESDFDYRDIDDVIHGRVRLSIMAYLSGADAAGFNELKEKVGVSDGNLSVHISKLEEAGYVAVEKRFAGKKPQTICRLSQTGRRAWLSYIERMAAILDLKQG